MKLHYGANHAKVKLPMRVTFGAVLSGLNFVFASPADLAQTYPLRPIRLIVPFPPGGSTDALARTISPRLGDAMGQTWVVDNRGGAGGNVGAEIVAHANPDGYTLLVGVDSQLTVNPTLYKLPFSVEKDLQPVTLLATAEQLLIVNPGATPKGIVERIRNEVIKVVQNAEVQTALARLALVPETSTPAELAARIRSETAKWAGVIKDAGIRLE